MMKEAETIFTARVHVAEGQIVEALVPSAYTKDWRVRWSCYLPYG